MGLSHHFIRGKQAGFVHNLGDTYIPESQIPALGGIAVNSDAYGGIDVGRIMAKPRQGQAEAVSIRSRHRCRENYRYLETISAGAWFQSAPGIHVGRIIYTVLLEHCLCGFNPLPASMSEKINPAFRMPLCRKQESYP